MQPVRKALFPLRYQGNDIPWSEEEKLLYAEYESALLKLYKAQAKSFYRHMLKSCRILEETEVSYIRQYLNDDEISAVSQEMFITKKSKEEQ